MDIDSIKNAINTKEEIISKVKLNIKKVEEINELILFIEGEKGVKISRCYSDYGINSFTENEVNNIVNVLGNILKGRENELQRVAELL